MRYLIPLFLFFLSETLFAQSEGQIEKQVVYFTKNNGDTIEIKAQTTAFSDTALITVLYVKNKNHKKLQQFKILFSSPLEVSIASFDNKKGINIVYDPAVRNGNSFLYLFNEAKNILQEVKGFRELGMISSIEYKSHKYFYSYVSCGCADECWISKLFTIKHYKIYTLEKLSCDCTSLISTYNKISVASSCETFDNKQKFENIAQYWKTVIEKGL